MTYRTKYKVGISPFRSSVPKMESTSIVVENKARVEAALQIIQVAFDAFVVWHDKYWELHVPFGYRSAPEVKTEILLKLKALSDAVEGSKGRAASKTLGEIETRWSSPSKESRESCILISRRHYLMARPKDGF